MIPISDPRERRINELLLRGHASSQEIFEADFGEWPPKGVSVQQENPQDTMRIDIRSFGDDPETNRQQKAELTQNYSGYMYTGKNTIFLNPRYVETFSLMGEQGEFYVLPDNERRATIGHEHIHIRQHGHRSNVLLNEKTLYRFFLASGEAAPSPLSKEHWDLLEFWSPTYNQDLGNELQASLHEVLTQGYPRWGKTPETREELWAAMANEGVDIPPEIQKILNNTPQGQKAQKIFGHPQAPSMSAPKTLNDHLELIPTDKGKESLWKNSFPEIYASLLDLYGDPTGKEKMGLGKNVISNAEVASYITATDLFEKLPPFVQRFSPKIREAFANVAEELTGLACKYQDIDVQNLRMACGQNLVMIALNLNDESGLFLKRPDETVTLNCNAMRDNLKNYPSMNTRNLLRHINALETVSATHMTDKHNQRNPLPSRPTGSSGTIAAMTGPMPS